MNHYFLSKLSFWYYVVIISVVLLVGSGASILTYRIVSLSAQKDLLLNVASISNALDYDDISNLTGTNADLNNPHYLSLKNKLERITGLSKEVRFSYLLGYRNDQVYFLVDSEPILSSDYSPPGQIYQEATLVEKQVLQKKLPSAIEFNKDRWGSWLTALVPILDNGRVVAIMGMDISANKYFQDIYVVTAIPIISTIFVLVLILIGFILRNKEERYLQLKEKLISVATHDLRSPLTSISWLVNTMLDDQEGIKGEHRTNLENLSERIKNLLHSVNELLDSGTKKDIKN